MSKAKEATNDFCTRCFKYNKCHKNQSDCTMADSYEEGYEDGYRQAKRDAKIAREEIYKWLEENAVSFVGLADDEHAPIGDTKAFYGTKSLIHYLKQAMKGEQG